MNLARSFTKRLVRPGSSDGNQPNSTRRQISEPMGLISTTNQWVHEVPNISDLHVKEVQQRQFSSASSNSTAAASDSGTSPTSDLPSMTDSSSVESFSPVDPSHTTPYFTPSSDVSRSKPSSAVIFASDMMHTFSSTVFSESEKPEQPENALIAAPTIPTRSISHSKREHERLARVRSIRSSVGSEVLTRSQHNSFTRGASWSAVDDAASSDLTIPPKSSSRPTSTVEEEPAHLNPFSSELKQLDEIAEEYRPEASTFESEEDAEDRRVMKELGLKSFAVGEYLQDIQNFRDGLWSLTEEEEDEEPKRPDAWF